MERDHGQWRRRRLGRTPERAGWLAWSRLQQVWLVHTAKFHRATTPRTDSVPAAVEDHDYRTNLPWRRLDGVVSLGVVRGHGGIENHGFRTLEMQGQEERPWGTKGAPRMCWGGCAGGRTTGWGLRKGRYLRAPRSRALTVASCVAWLKQVSIAGEARRRARRVVAAH